MTTRTIQTSAGSEEVSNVTQETTTDDQALRRYIKDLTLLQSEEGFTLASGRRSHFIFNMKNLYGEPEPAALITERLLKTLDTLSFDLITGLELGAVFPVTAAILASNGRERPVSGFIIRKTAKGHGTKNRIEGLRNLPDSGRVVVIDDVTTTGGSLYEAVEVVREVGLEVSHAVTLVDREEGAAGFLLERGITLVPLFRKSDFLSPHVV